MFNFPLLISIVLNPGSILLCYWCARDGLQIHCYPPMIRFTETGSKLAFNAAFNYKALYTAILHDSNMTNTLYKNKQYLERYGFFFYNNYLVCLLKVCGFFFLKKAETKYL